MLSPQLVIGLVTLVGVLVILGLVVYRLSKLAGDEAVRKTFLNLVDPVSLTSLFILLGILFLLGTAILDLDKGKVLAAMGRAEYARGVITYLFAVVTIGTAVVLVLSALLGTEEKRFQNGKEVLGLLLGVFGTIVGFYFASELAHPEGAGGRLSVTPILVEPSEIAAGGRLDMTAAVRGGTPPYRFAVTFGEETPTELIELVRSDGWIRKQMTVAATERAGIHAVTVGVEDAEKQKASVRAFFAVPAAAAPPK